MEKASETATSHDAGTDAQRLSPQAETGPAPTDSAVDLTAYREPGPNPKAGSAWKSPERDVETELAEAVSDSNMLKAKLAEAEKRVRRLEAEKKAADLGSATARVNLSSNHVPQVQTTWPSLGIWRPSGACKRIDHPSAGKEIPNSVETQAAAGQGPSTPSGGLAWHVVLPTDYPSTQQERRFQKSPRQ